MIIAATIEEVRKITKEWKKEGLAIGLAPTMGYLHKGHESLIRRSAADNDKTVVSIFVNPAQFGEDEDFEVYPRDFDRDSKICREAGADLIFYPSVEEMYPTNFFAYTDVRTMTEGMDGGNRPEHFKGVCTVVSKLFHIVGPDKAYFGQKDAQQLAVIRKMVRDLNFDLEIIGCPNIREEDGLAMSSRNAYLSHSERQAAVILSKALCRAAALAGKGERNATVIIQDLKETIMTETLAEIEYIQIVEPDRLRPVTLLEKPALIALAVKFGKTRLIDNMIWE